MAPSSSSESSAEQSQASRWTYQHQEAASKPSFPLFGVLQSILLQGFIYCASVVFPLVVLMTIYWFCAKFLEDTFLAEPWVQPSVFLVSAFTAGIFLRMGIEILYRSMGAFILVILGVITYAAICWLDIQQSGGVFSMRLLPEALRNSLSAYTYATPITSIAGMLCYQWFTLKS